LDADHGVEPAKTDDIQRELWTDGIEDGIDLPRIVLIHREADPEAFLAAAERPQDLEAAEMRAQQEAARSALQYLGDDLLAMNVQIEKTQLTVQQIDAIEHAGSKAVVVAKQVNHAGAP